MQQPYRKGQRGIAEPQNLKSRQSALFIQATTELLRTRSPVLDSLSVVGGHPDAEDGAEVTQLERKMPEDVTVPTIQARGTALKI
jgi:hypothetical protein